MSNAVFPAIATLALTGGFDATTAVLKMQAVHGYTYDAADEFLDDVTTLLSDPIELTVTAITSGVVEVDPVVFVAFPEGDSIDGFVVFVDTEDPATSTLVCWIDRRRDSVPVTIAPTGANITLTFTEGLFRL